MTDQYADLKAALEQTCHALLIKDPNFLRTLIAEKYALAAEIKEQAQMLGISAERELRLKAERDALREALELMVEMIEMNGFGFHYVMDVARTALAREETS